MHLPTTTRQKQVFAHEAELDVIRNQDGEVDGASHVVDKNVKIVKMRNMERNILADLKELIVEDSLGDLQERILNGTISLACLRYQLP